MIAWAQVVGVTAAFLGLWLQVLGDSIVNWRGRCTCRKGAAAVSDYASAETTGELVERVRASLDYLYNWTGGKGPECVADGRVALDELQHRLERAERERDDRILTHTADEWLAHRFNQEYDRAESAEALVAELREALRGIAYGMALDQFGVGYHKAGEAAREIARAALAKTEEART